LSVEIHCLFNCHFIPDKRTPPWRANCWIGRRSLGNRQCRTSLPSGLPKPSRRLLEACPGWA
jgi:hypothetical protein